MTGDSAVRRAEDIGGTELSYAEVKAIASGNPAVLTLAEADAELQRLSILKKNHADEQYIARRRRRELPEAIERIEKRLANLTADLQTIAACRGDAMTINDRRIPKEAAAEILSESMGSLPPWVAEMRRVPLGLFRGLRFGLVLHVNGPPEVYLEGTAARRYTLSKEHHGARAMLNALERLADSYDSECDRSRQDLAIGEAQLRDYQARLGVPFVYESYLSQLTVLRDQLKIALSGTTSEVPAESPLSVSGLAESIKGLKAAQTVEVAPERIGKRRGSAEEPVTFRIRRRLEAMLGPQDVR